MTYRLVRQALALEAEVSDGRAVRELEHTIYGRMTNLEELKKAPVVEGQEQWELRIPLVAGQNAAKGTLRVRKTTGIRGEGEGQPPLFILTTKVDGADESKGRFEVPVPTTEDNFTQFQFLSGKGMLKHRHRFPVPERDLCWEVDVYLLPDGSYCEWVKIDLEVSDLTAELPPLPVTIDPETLITASRANRSEAEERRVTELYDKYFLKKNVFLEQVGNAPVRDDL
jgi:CYTH domain-containing protein